MPLDQRVGLLPTFPVSAHHEDRRFHAKVADALQQVEALSTEQGVAYSRHDHIQENEVEALTVFSGTFQKSLNLVLGRHGYRVKRSEEIGSARSAA
jgi:hypothetical protein